MKLKRIYFSLFLSILLFFQSSALVFATAVSVTGKIKILNTDNSYIDFANYNSSVTVDDVSGSFNGYAFSEDVGWVDFGSEDNPLGPVSLNLVSGAITGKAYVLNTGAYLDFTNYSSNAVLGLPGNIFTGYVFSEDVGWADFSDTGVVTTVSIPDPFNFDLDSPSNNSYVGSNRPTFRWRASTNNSSLSKYSLEIDNGETGDFSATGIPFNRTTDYIQSTFDAKYDGFSDTDTANNYISVYTKSSPDWNNTQNNGELKEGKRSWTVKAHDSAGTVQGKTRTLFVDFTGPGVGGAQINGFVIPANAGIYTNTGSPIGSGMTTADSTPTFTGRVTDALMGDVVANKVASGPNSLEVKIEKKNNITNLYTLHSLANVNFTDTYWTDTNEKITDNSKNTYSKYANYSYTPSEELTNGSYKISITGKDLAGNSGGSQVFNLNVGSSYLPHRQAGITPSIWERDGDTTDEDELINQLEEQPDLVVQVPETSLNIFQRLIAFISYHLEQEPYTGLV